MNNISFVLFSISPGRIFEIDQDMEKLQSIPKSCPKATSERVMGMEKLQLFLISCP